MWTDRYLSGSVPTTNEIGKLHFGYLSWYINYKWIKRYSSPAVEAITYFPEAVALGLLLKLSLIVYIFIKI
jgi:hypothetical protein